MKNRSFDPDRICFYNCVMIEDCFINMAEREIEKWKKTLIEEVDAATKRILIDLEEQHHVWEVKSEEMEQMILSARSKEDKCRTCGHTCGQ